MSDGSIKIMTELQTDAFEKGLDKIKSASMAGAKAATVALTAAGTAALVAGVKYNASIESYQTSFEVMTGSAEKAAEVIANLKKVGADTPFELTDLADTTVLLMNYGLTADDAQKKLMMLGDISQGSAEKMQGIATAYGQMSSAGKVSLEDVKQMIERGFNPLEEISRTTGESMASLYDRISKGTISVDEITASMERSTAEGGRYFKSMDKQSQTLNGQWSTLKDTALQLIGQGVEPLTNKLRDVIVPGVIKKIEEFDKKFKGTEETMKDVGQAVGKAAKDFEKFVPLVAAGGAAIASYKAYVSAATAVTALSTGFRAAALAVEAYVAANGMSAVSTTASVASLTLKQIAVGLLTGQLTLATATQMAWNAVMVANPIGLVVAGIAALIAGMAVYEKMTISESEALVASSQKRTEKINKLKEESDAWNTTIDAQKKSIESGNGEIQHLRALWDELQRNVDANGQVRSGYEQRADYITTTLADALGIEISMTDGVIDNYDQMKQSIMALIEIKQAELVLQSQEAAYAQALQDRASKYLEIEDAEKKLKQTSEELATAQKNLHDPEQIWNAEELKKTVETVQKEYDKQNKAVEGAKKQYQDYNSTIASYEGLSAALISGDAAKIKEAMLTVTYDLQDIGSMTSTELDGMLVTYQKWGTDLQAALANGTEGVDQKMVDDINAAITRLQTEIEGRRQGTYASGAKLGTGVSEGVASVDITGNGTKAANEYKAGIDGGVGASYVSGQAVAEGAKAGFGVVNPFPAGTNASVQFGLGIGAQKSTVGANATDVADGAKTNLGKVKTDLEGVLFSGNFAKGINKGSTDASTNASTVATNSKSKLSVDTSSSGGFFSSGFARGIFGGIGDAIDAAVSLASSALRALKSTIKEGSPSKETKQSGRFFGQGFAIGIKEEEKLVASASENLGATALNALDSTALVAKMQGAIAMQSSNISTSIGAKVDHVVSSENDLQENLIDYDRLGVAVVNALTEGNVNFVTNEREWATLVRGVK